MRTILTHTHKGRAIIVENTWFSGARLYIDGDIVAQTHKLMHLNRDVPVFTHDLETEGGTDRIEVFMDATRLKPVVHILLQINGETVARDD